MVREHPRPKNDDQLCRRIVRSVLGHLKRGAEQSSDRVGSEGHMEAARQTWSQMETGNRESESAMLKASIVEVARSCRRRLVLKFLPVSVLGTSELHLREPCPSGWMDSRMSPFHFLTILVKLSKIVSRYKNAMLNRWNYIINFSTYFLIYYQLSL